MKWLVKFKKRRHNRHLYRSGLEESIAELLDKHNVQYTYEKDRISYIVPESSHIYTPDFVFQTKSNKQIIIECKGIWSYEDRYKHLLLKQQYGDELDIRFVFTRSKSRISKGSKTTYADICGGLGRGSFKGYTWKYSDRTIPEEWFNE